MKDKWVALSLLLGLLGAMIIHSFRETEETRSIPDNLPTPEQTQTTQDVIPVKEVKPTPLTEATPSKSVSRSTPTNRKVEESIRGLLLNEASITDMELHQDDLKNYAYTVETSEGWKIEIRPSDEVFQKAGLSSGDLITYESLDQQMEIPEKAPLVRRLINVLNSIKNDNQGSQ